MPLKPYTAIRVCLLRVENVLEKIPEETPYDQQNFNLKNMEFDVRLDLQSLGRTPSRQVDLDLIN